MRRFATCPIIIALAGLSLLACGNDESASVAVEGDCPAGLADAMAAWKDAGFNGVIVLGADEEQSCAISAGGRAPQRDDSLTVDSVFAIGSVSKVFTAAAVLQLEADGAVDGSGPLSSFVADVTGPVGAATVDSLLRHTSGLVGSIGEDHQPLSRADAVSALDDLSIDDAARGSFLYSNAGYTALTMVVEAAAGVDYRTALVDAVLPEGAGFWDGDPAAAGDRVIGVIDGEPAASVGSFDGPHWAMQGNGDLAMSPAVLQRWTVDLFNGDVISPAVVTRLLEPVVDADGQGVTAGGWVRLSSDVLGEDAIAAAGGGGDTGHAVVVVWLPDSQRSMVIASSTDGVDAESLLRAIGPAIVTGAPIPRPDTPVDVDPASLAGAAGVYSLTSGGRLEVTVDGDGLVVAPTGIDAVAAMRPDSAASADEVAEHERLVRELLAGTTEAGRDELDALADSFGELTAMELLGTTADAGELHTFVRLRFGERVAEGWYALNGSGGVEAVDLSGAPQFSLIAVPGGFRVDDDAGNDEAVTVTFDEASMTIDRGDAPVVATRADS